MSAPKPSPSFRLRPGLFAVSVCPETPDADVAFMAAAEAARVRRPRRAAFWLLWCISGLLTFFLIWAALARIDEVARAEGEVVGSRRMQSISNLEGGILHSLHVREGDVVAKGDILAQLDNESAASSYRDNLTKALEHSLALIRLEAELRGEEPVFPSDYTELVQELAQRQPDVQLQDRGRRIIADQQSAHAAHVRKVAADIAVLREQLAQRELDVREQRERQRHVLRRLELTREQCAAAQALLRRNSYSRMEYLGLEQQRVELEGEVAALDVSIPRAEAAADEARQRIEQRLAEVRASLAEDINKRRLNLASLRESLAAGGDRVTRTEIRSPVSGTIQQIHSHTLGGVIKPGVPILTIVPLDENIEVEARVRPRDVAFLRPGQKASIKVTAYDYALYGSLDGRLESISADTIKDEQGAVFYRVRLRTRQAGIRHKGKLLPVIPGMVVSVDILTGKRSLLRYLTKPLFRTVDNALHER